ncbi:MAG: alanine--tRNA ligase [Cytophagales bacterium]|nr:alanine--tRNA ligase [Cytophagales bacterium]
MDSKQIRAKFKSFFEEKSHKIVPSAPIVVKDDPTLMFTNAGMNQFKDYFLGNKKAEFKRVADTQKCLRVSGKHNDLEEVGFDTYHHTMFEMLGNWSFGDYFKAEAIAWAWELLTEEFELPKDRLYATVFEGSKEDNLATDEEALKLWKNILPEDRVLFGDKKDNFWEMGDTGPCGPCSELHIDLRPQEEVDKLSGRELVNKDHPQVVEVWNLVFMQFNRMSDGSLIDLPEQHVDTGMGFERLVMAIQQKQSNYDTDVFQPIITEVANWAGIKYGDDEKKDIALRVIADHIRAISFTIADGQLPSNAKAGYVIRRILRRAVRYGYTFLDFQEPFLNKLVPMLAEQFSDIFPELINQKEFVTKVITEEEIAFLRTLDKGLKRLDEFKNTGNKVIDGATSFELYDTYGFPYDLTALIAGENGLEVNKEAFDAEMAVQKERSKNAAKQESGDWIELLPDSEHSSFLAYEHLEAKVRIVKYREVKQKNKSLFQIVLDQTPFYAESGGQVGDTGFLINGEDRVKVIDTKKENELIVHILPKLPKEVEAEFDAKVDAEKRMLTENNHSATHLMHAALRQVLGSHVQQRGSFVNEKILRFDFSHFSKMTPEEIKETERIVNRKVRENVALDEKRNVPIGQAKEMGATALFGEKYGDFVRVITFDADYSVELCGGTHVKQTGQIGAFKIISEGSVAAGVRRIEAISALGAEQLLEEQFDTLNTINDLLKSPKAPVEAVTDLMNERQALKKQIEQLQLEKVAQVKEALKAQIKDLGQARLLVAKTELPDSDSLKSIAFQFKKEFPNLIQLIGAEIGGKPQLTVMIDEPLLESLELNASQLVREMAKNIKGGGGGQPFYATAGGKDVSGLDNALKHGESVVKEKLSE